MKKDYLKPESNVLAFSIDNVIMVTSNEDNSPVRPGVGPEGEWSNKNRGEWGNVWDK